MDSALRAPLSAQEALSGIFGSVSLAAWVFVLVPQLIENYKLGSANGVSIAFLLVWLIGDLTNLLGSLWASLVPTVVALAIYFCLSDVTLLGQCLYYNYVAGPKDSDQSVAVDDRSSSSDLEQPLLSSDNLGLPGSRRRSSASYRRRDSYGSTLPREHVLDSLDDEPSALRASLTNVVCVLLVAAIGVLGWFLAWRAEVWTPVPAENDIVESDTPVGAEILGYISSVCYLGARIPQIVKNYQEKSCAGLSLLFFILSTVGNLTYGAGILFHSTSGPYIVKNIPWLLGSLGTIFEDAIILVQFRLYRPEAM